MNLRSECDKTLDHGIVRDEQSYEGNGCNGQRIITASGAAGQKEGVARTAFKEKEWGYTVRLFGMKSFKEGAV
jgi:hypothetical protein